MFVCSVIVVWTSLEVGLMRWKAFFQAMFDWRTMFFGWRRLSNFFEFPLESLIFAIGVVGAMVLMVLIAEC